MTHRGRYPPAVREWAVCLVRGYEGEYASQWATTVSTTTPCSREQATMRHKNATASAGGLAPT